MFLLPAHVRHSPQRPQEGSIGLVIEPERPRAHWGRSDGIASTVGALVHRAEIDLENIVDDLPPIYNAFYEQTELRKCPECGEAHPARSRQMGPTTSATSRRATRVVLVPAGAPSAPPSRLLAQDAQGNGAARIVAIGVRDVAATLRRGPATGRANDRPRRTGRP